MKKCSRCKEEKTVDSFYRAKSNRDGFSAICKICKKGLDKEYYISNSEKIRRKVSEYQNTNKDEINAKVRNKRANNLEFYRAQQSEWREKHKDKISGYAKADSIKNRDRISRYQKEYYVNNSDKIKAKSKKYAEENCKSVSDAAKKYRDLNRDEIKIKKKNYYQENKEQISSRRKKYICNNRHKINARARNRRLEDEGHRIACACRIRINKALKMKQAPRTKTLIELLGCSIDEFKQHLQSLFTEGMTWENYGKYGWHIDHRLPCASFDLTDPEQQKQCFHYSNLQPLWAFDNLSKGAKII